MLLQSPRGTRDWLPEEAYVKRVVSEKIRKVFESYGYGEIITPAFEYLELLKAKAGEEVVNQIYYFKDKAGRELGLRFEMTTPIARIVASKPDLAKPIRFYYIQPVWRYEEPQRGRLREFWQAGIELFGVAGPEGDAEVVAVTYDALTESGVQEFEISVNDRRVVEDILLSNSVAQERLPDALRILDKLDKFGESYIIDEFEKIGVSREKSSQMLIKLKESRLDIELSTPEGKQGLDHLSRVVDLLKSVYGVNVKVDYSIVRGLGYYTGFVFEVKPKTSSDVGSIAGGGRYDDLVSTLGGPKLPATGMAIGVDRLLEVLKLQGKPTITYNEVDVYIIPLAKKQETVAKAVEIAKKLRREGLKVIVEGTDRSLAKALEYASKKGSRFVIIIGEKELSSSTLTIRDMKEWVEHKLQEEKALEMIINSRT
jgi:histidyl-tRNA synthetase